MLSLASYANVITGIEGTDKSHLRLILLLDRLLTIFGSHFYARACRSRFPDFSYHLKMRYFRHRAHAAIRSQ